VRLNNLKSTCFCFLFVFVFCVFSGSIYSQCNSKEIDSLTVLLKTETDEREILEIKKALGTTNTECGYYVKGLEYYLSIFSLAEKLRDTTSMCMLNNNVAVIYKETGQNKLCLQHATKAVFFGEKQKNKGVLADAYNTLGSYYYQNYEDSLAFRYFNLALQNRLLTGDKLKTASAYNNLGDIYFEAGDKDKGIELVKKAMALRLSLKNWEAVSSSYELLGEMYLNINKLDSSLHYFNKFKVLLVKSKSLYVLKSFYESYAELCYKLKMNDSCYAYQKKFIAINDSILNTKSAEQFIEMQTKYETQKKETDLKLSTLEIEKQKEKSFYTTVFFIVVLIATLLSFFLFYFSYKAKQTKKFITEVQHQETLRYTAVIKTLEKERGRIAEELHDNTGALVSFIISKTDWALNNNSKPEDLRQIKSSAQEVMTSLRETLWTLNNKSITNVDLIDKLKIYIKKHLLVESKISSEEIIETVLPNEVVLSLYRCVQEIINNINKHSKATSVSVKFITTLTNKFGLVIIDNGIGFEADNKEDNYGIRNLKNRMLQINAELVIKSQLNQGTTVELYYK
jgi:two-component system NarL family sensor kinase